MSRKSLGVFILSILEPSVRKEIPGASSCMGRRATEVTVSLWTLLHMNFLRGEMRHQEFYYLLFYFKFVSLTAVTM